MKYAAITLFLLLAAPNFAQIIDTTWVFGVTIDDPWTNTDGIVDAFANHCQKPTARIVFDENVAPTEYTDVINQLAPHCFIMGEILDSYYVSNYSVSNYLDRTTMYLNEFEDSVDIWEVGNEVNGDWLGTDVVQKIQGAFNQVKYRQKKAALTLYYNRDCYYDHPENEMFTWVNDNLPESMKSGLDYVLVSYYEDDCEGVQLSEAEWQDVFDSLHVIFPNSKLGIGECGTTNAANKAEYIQRYYNMNITTPNYIGGYFWWYYKDDCVPKSNSLWTTINDISCEHVTTTESIKSTPVMITPNPAHDIIFIKNIGGNPIRVQITNVSGKIVIDSKTTTNSLNINKLTPGLYFLSITSNGIYHQKLVVE